MATKKLAETLRWEAKRLREELNQVMVGYLERIDYLNTQARRLENGDNTFVGEPSPWSADWPVRLQSLRSKDAQ